METQNYLSNYHKRIIFSLDFLFRTDELYSQHLNNDQIQKIRTDSFQDLLKCMGIGVIIISSYKFIKGRQNYQSYFKGTIQGISLGFIYSFYYIESNLVNEISTLMAENEFKQKSKI